jgi:uncharacterized membrane protein YeaQ/YmgE (transglycosylase-associated protein family)
VVDDFGLRRRVPSAFRSSWFQLASLNPEGFNQAGMLDRPPWVEIEGRNRAPVRADFVSVRTVSIVVVLIIIIIALLLAGSLIGLAFSLLWLGLTGLIIGALGRLVLPGRHDISLLATALVGIAASLLGGILADAFDVGRIVQFLVAVALAAIGITLFASSEHSRVT